MNKQRVFLICLVLMSSKLFGAVLDIHNYTGEKVAVRASTKKGTEEEWLTGFTSWTMNIPGGGIRMLMVTFYSTKGIKEDKKLELLKNKRGKVQGGKWVLIVEKGTIDKLDFRLFTPADYKNEKKGGYKAAKRFTL